MNRSRTLRILSNVVEKEDNASCHYEIPKYESTKSTTAYERELFLRVYPYLNWSISPEKDTIQHPAVSSSNKKCVPVTILNTSDFRRQIDFDKDPNVLTEIAPNIAKDSTSSAISCDVITSNYELNNCIENPFSDSGSEYFPSSSDSSVDDKREASLVISTTKKQNKNISKVPRTTTEDWATDECSIPENGWSDQSHVLVNMNKNSNSLKVAVKLPVVNQTNDGKRIRNKRHCCYICDKILSNNMARHFELLHGNDIEVAKILAMPKNSKARRDQFQSLIRAGDFYYNCNILSLKEGELILVRTSVDDSLSYKDFGPCPHCLGFMSRKYLWHHIKLCSNNKFTKCDETKDRKGALIESSALIFDILRKQGSDSHQDFTKNIIVSFRQDSVSDVCKEDQLILKLGAFLYEKYGKSQAEIIRQSMRQLARLKIEIINIYEFNKCLSDYIAPRHFDILVEATRNICGNEINNLDNSNTMKVPSLALKIGHLIRKCIALESGNALRKGLVSRHAELKSLSELMDLEWATKISSKALTTLHHKQINTPQLLPLTSDLMKLNMYLQHQLNSLVTKIQSNCNRQIWCNLASVTLCRIILFNKRRSGEAAKMTMHTYLSRPPWSQQGVEEFKNSLSPLELKLASMLTVVNIRGKRGRHVPVILTTEVKSAIDILLKYREKADISPTNLYIFARSQGSEENLRGHDCLRRECINAGLTSAENVTSTKLRKYIATVCQIFNLTENESDWLARHLGHDIRVHREFYRMHDSAVELTKVSRLLLAVDNGEAHKYSGKKLEDINIEDLPPIDPDNVVDDDKDYVDGDNIEDTNTEVEAKSLNTPNNNKKMPKKKICSRNPWTPEELECVLKYFSKCIKFENLPGKQDCEKCIKENVILRKRKWTDIKFCIKNQIFKRKNSKSK